MGGNTSLWNSITWIIVDVLLCSMDLGTPFLASFSKTWWVTSRGESIQARTGSSLMGFWALSMKIWQDSLMIWDIYTQELRFVWLSTSKWLISISFQRFLHEYSSNYKGRSRTITIHGNEMQWFDINDEKASELISFRSFSSNKYNFVSRKWLNFFKANPFLIKNDHLRFIWYHMNLRWNNYFGGWTI